MAKTNTIRSNSLQTNSVRLNGVEGLRRVSLQAGEIPDIPPTYTLSASVTNGKVTAKLNGSAVNLPFTANEGDVIIVEVTPNDGYSFEGWNDGNTDNPRSITMNADVVLSAECVEVVQPPVGKYIQFEDAEVERVLMANGVSSDGVGITIEDAEKVTSISTWFKNNKSISAFTELRFFTNVKTLVDNAFLACSSLKNIDLTNIETMGVRVFGDGGDLSEYDVDMPNLKTLSQGKWNQLFSKTNIRSIVNLGTVTKLEGVDANTSCFDHCVNLQSAYLPNTLTEIGYGTFAFCSALAYVDIPSSVVTIGADAFAQCKALEELDIPQSIQSIGENAFGFDDNLQKLKVRASVPPSLATDNVFQGCPLITIYVPDASLEAYKTAVNWSAYADRIHPLSEIEGDDSRLDYVHDSMLMWLDGIDKGTIEGEWQDLVSGNTFVNDGAIALADGWEFDGTSASMQSQSLGDYVWVEKSRTLEVVLTFYREGVNEIAFAGMSGCMAFGLYQNEYILSMSPLTLPSVNAEVSRGLIFGASYSKGIFVRALANGEPRQIASEQQYWGNAVDNYSFLGRRSNGTYFKGKIHAIRIHDRILTEEEILHNQRLDNERFNLGLDI